MGLLMLLLHAVVDENLYMMGPGFLALALSLEAPRRGPDLGSRKALAPALFLALWCLSTRGGLSRLAMGQAAFDFSSHYMTQRKVFGQELARMQHWQYKFAEHATQIEMARSLYQKAAIRFDKEGGADIEAAMAKLVGSRLACDMARDAIQVCGAYGFVKTLSGPGKNFPLESIYRDAKIGEIYEGANEIQSWVIARHIFGREYTG